MVMGLFSGLSLANHFDSESFLVVHALFGQDGCQRGFWEMVRHVVSPFDLSLTLLVGGGLLVLCSLAGPPVVKLLMQMVTMVPGQGGQFQSVCFPWQNHLRKGRGPSSRCFLQLTLLPLTCRRTWRTQLRLSLLLGAWQKTCLKADLGSLCAPVTKKAPSGVTERAALVPGWYLLPSLTVESAGALGCYPHTQGLLTYSNLFTSSFFKSE